MPPPPNRPGPCRRQGAACLNRSRLRRGQARRLPCFVGKGAACRNCSRPPATGSAPGRPWRMARTRSISASTNSTPGCGPIISPAADLPKLMAFLHRRGVQGYVTFNTLVFENELADAQNYLRSIIAAGVDAAIVQDVGICRLIREFSPDFPIHASTQMTVTSAAGVEFCRALGCNLVVLARECSLADIEKIQQGAGGAECRRWKRPGPIRHSSFVIRIAARGVRPRRVVRGLFRPVSHQRVARRTLGQSRRMRASLPDAVRIDCGWPSRAAGRPEISPEPAGSGRLGNCCPNSSAPAWPR